ncbi:MAG: efflux RND transporter periplasmic adaptor subunit [Patescibacteria group bacterium]|jgi:RND family efflux transporter MFP subunit
MKFSVKKHSNIIIIITVAVVIVAAMATRLARNKAVQSSEVSFQPSVELLAVRDYSQNSRAISANGTVESLQQVDIKSEAGGKLTQVLVKIGDKVRAGQVLMTVDQRDAAAALTSAQGSFTQAQANYDSILAGATDKDVATNQAAVEVVSTSLANARQDLLNEVVRAKSEAETVVLTNTNNLFNNPQSSSPKFVIADTVQWNGQTDSIESKRVAINGLWEQWQAEVSSASVNNIEEKTAASLEHLSFISGYLGDIITTLSTYTISSSDAAKAVVASDQAIVVGAKTKIDALITTINNYNQAVKSSESSLNQASASLALKQAPAKATDIKSAQAQVLIAQSRWQAAQAAYEKTAIKTPFSGIITALPVKYSDFITSGQKVASVVNEESGLQVKVFVSGADLPLISNNIPVQIGEAQIAGIVTNFAPSVDATTRTAEVNIAVSDPEKSGLIIGQNVSVDILGTDGAAVSNSYIIPIQSVRFTDGKAVVYIIDGDQKAQEVAVTAGQVSGENVEITSGLADDMKIAANAYDISAGQKIQIIGADQN